MRAGCLSVVRRMVVSLVFVVLAGAFISSVVPACFAEEAPGSPPFKDPYNGGIKLPNDGGEPGKAYMAFINAAYRKDHAELCRLIAPPAEVAQCLQQKDALDGYIAMFTQPKSHKVLGGFMKGDEATLDVAYTFESAQSSGFVVMKRTNEKWTVSSFGGSGSGSVSAAASGQADLGSGAASGAASASSNASAGGDFPEFAIINISPNTREYTGKCPATIAFTADITFKMPLPEKFSYRWEFSDGRKLPERVVKPPRTGHLSLREVWRSGKPGEELEASVRFSAEANGALIIKDPPGVKVICR